MRLCRVPIHTSCTHPNAHEGTETRVPEAKEGIISTDNAAGEHVRRVSTPKSVRKRRSYCIYQDDS